MIPVRPEPDAANGSKRYFGYPMFCRTRRWWSNMDHQWIQQGQGMTLAHLSDAESRGEISPRVPLLMAIRDRLAAALRKEE
jgi:hypothetical protein